MSMGGMRLKNGLTDKQDVFVKQYLSNGFDGIKAAIKAGYSEHTAKAQSSQLLAREPIKKVIDLERKRLANKLDVTREYVLKGLCEIFDNKAENSKTRISAAAEINKMCGFNEPEKHLHEHSGQISTVLLLPDNKRGTK